MHRNFWQFLMANMKDRWKPKIKLFTVGWYLLPLQRYELSKSRKSWEKMRQENWAFCAPLTKIVTSQVGLLLIKYLNQMSFRRYCSESSKTWYTYETRWKELQNIKYFVAMTTLETQLSHFLLPSKATIGIHLFLVCISTPKSTFDYNRLKLFTS